MITTVKIKRFTVLKDFEFDFKNHHFLICGKNGLGKSSVMRFIRIALGDTNAIAPGSEGSGEVWTNKNGQQYILKVDIKNGKSKITITGENGLSDSTKGALFNIMGAVSLDVNRFIELSGTEAGRKEQVQIFKSMLPKETQEELRKFENNVAALYSERTDLGKDVKKKDAEVKANPLNHLIDKELDKFVQVDVAATMEEMKVIQARNKKVQEIMDRKAARETEMASQRVLIERMKKDLALAEESLKANETKQEDASVWLAQPANKIFSTEKQEELIKSGTKTNQDYADAQKLKADKKLLVEMVNDQENYTIRIETERQLIQDTIKDIAGGLVPGVTYNEEGLIWNGRLLHPNTHSTGEHLEFAMLLKMAENKDLGVLFLEHTESIDEERMNRILEISSSHGWQVLGEEVRKRQDQITFEIIGK